MISEVSVPFEPTIPSTNNRNKNVSLKVRFNNGFIDNPVYNKNIFKTASSNRSIASTSNQQSISLFKRKQAQNCTVDCFWQKSLRVKSRTFHRVFAHPLVQYLYLHNISQFSIRASSTEVISICLPTEQEQIFESPLTCIPLLGIKMKVFARPTRC